MFYVGKNDMPMNKISDSSMIILEKAYLLKPSMIELPIVIRVLPFDFLDTVHKNITKEVDEIDIKFTFNLDGITFSYYTAQPKSMIQRKPFKKN